MFKKSCPYWFYTMKNLHDFLDIPKVQFAKCETPVYLREVSWVQLHTVCQRSLVHIDFIQLKDDKTFWTSRKCSLHSVVVFVIALICRCQYFAEKWDVFFIMKFVRYKQFVLVSSDPIKKWLYLGIYEPVMWIRFWTKPDPGFRTSNEGRFLKFYKMNIIDTF